MMKAIIRFADKRPIECKLVPKPKPLPGTVIVKIMASSINHRDPSLCAGLLSYVPIPPDTGEDCCGLSAAGKIVEVGEGVSQDLIGKKVACHKLRTVNQELVFGSWCQYGRYPVQSLNFLDDSVKYEDACGDSVSPLLIHEIIAELKAKSFVINGAMSETGRMIVLEGLKRGLEVIAIVRKKWQEDFLKGKGAKHVINSTDPKFSSLLFDKCKELNCTLVFDGIGGEATGKLIQGLLNGTKIYVYGFLGKDRQLTLSPMTMAMKNLTIQIFLSDVILLKKSPEEFKKFQEYIAEDLRTTKCLKMEVSAMFTLEKINEALESFESFGSKGKVIFLPNFSLE